jgi:hypothetical protein
MDTGRSSRRWSHSVRPMTIGALVILCAIVALMILVWRGTTPLV